MRESSLIIAPPHCGQSLEKSSSAGAYNLSSIPA